MLTLEKRKKVPRKTAEIETDRESAPAIETGLPTSTFEGPILRPVSIHLRYLQW